MADIFILKERPSIYRDFVQDFWIKFKSGFKQGFIYLGMNPLVEIVYGFPFLWFIIYYSIEYPIGEIESVLLKVVLVCLGLFFLISFRLTRFLGEPQRYLEFAIPFISILFVLYFGLEYIIGIGLFSLLLIASAEIMARKEFHNNENTNEKIEVINKIKTLKSNSDIIISNDNDIIKYLPQFGINVLRPDYTLYYKNKVSFYNNYKDMDIYIISEEFIKTNIQLYNVNYIIINKNHYNYENKQYKTIFENKNFKIAINNES